MFVRNADGRSERGQILILFVGVFSLFLLLAAFAIDQGMWQDKRRISQKDADTSARGGAVRYLSNLNDTTGAAAQAKLVAAQNLAKVNNLQTTFVGKTSCTDFKGNTTAGVPSVETQINHPTVGLFSSLFGVDKFDVGARATACVGRPSGQSGLDPYYTAPGSQSDPCFNADGSPALGVPCIFKTDSQGQQFGSRGNLNLADSPGACTQKTKKDLREEIEQGAEGYCQVGDVVDISQGNNTAENIKGLNCRVDGSASQCADNHGEGSCDAGFHDNNGSIPPFTNPKSANGIDDFTEAFSKPDGSRPTTTTGSEFLIPNACPDGQLSPRILTIIVGETCPVGGCKSTVTIHAFATFYLYGCVKLDNNGNVQGNIDVKCSGNGNSGVIGLFVKAFIPDGGGTPLPPSGTDGVSIYLVK